jgi:excisionase family DNA binding protein
MAAGELRSVKIGRSRRIPVAALLAFVSAIQEGSAA